MFLAIQLKMARAINKALYILISFALLYSCGKDIEVLTPVKDCRITGTHSQLKNEWRFLNYNSIGDVISFSNQSFFSYIERDKSLGTFKFLYSDTEVYTKIEDTIFCKLLRGNKIIRKLSLKNNFIESIVDSQNRRHILFYYTNGYLTREEYLSFTDKRLFFSKDYVQDEGELFDYYNVVQNDILYLENKLISKFFGLGEKYGKLKNLKIKAINTTGVIYRDEEYNFRYETNERGLISKKIVEEVKQGLYKDTVSYTYTCKF